MEVYQSLPEGTLAELIEGILYMSPAPNPFHQRAIRSLFLQIYEFVNTQHLGEVFFSPIDVYLDDVKNAVQPDIIFLKQDGQTTISKKGVHGAPEFVVEVMSPGNPSHDLITKKSLYERFGVKEYWIVDPETKETTGFYLENNRYQSISSIPGKLKSRLFNADFTF